MTALADRLQAIAGNVCTRNGTLVTLARKGRATNVSVRGLITHLDDDQPSLLKLQSAGINWADARPHRFTVARGNDILPGDTMDWDGWNWVVLVEDGRDFGDTSLTQGFIIYRTDPS